MWNFFQPDNRDDEPYIQIATGNYLTDLEKFGRDEALALILETISHELTHYFQWINNIKLTEIGYERQASAYLGYILDEYADVVDSPYYLHNKQRQPEIGLPLNNMTNTISFL